MSSSRRPIAILGAGLSGLSLACALVETGVTRPILLLDRRTDWPDDRTWCLWATRPWRFLDAADHHWPSWRVVSGPDTARARSARHPYVHLSAGAVYDRALTRLAEAPNLELRPGVAVEYVDCDGGHPRVHTSRGELDAELVFDAMGVSSPLQRATPLPAIEFGQRFVGWEVEVERPVFEPDTATLMDFRDARGDGLRFLYVLPFTTTRALIEDTSIGRRAVAPDTRRAFLARELEGRLAVGEWRVVREERGHVPMSTRRFTVAHGPAVHSVGTAAGAVRPSSGYAFARIQAHSTAVAAAVADGRPLPRVVGSRRLSVLDTIFLHALDAKPERFPEIFRRLVGDVPADAFARFMTDTSTLLDEARIVAALPKRPFLAASARVVRTALDKPPAPSVATPAPSG